MKSEIEKLVKEYPLLDEIQQLKEVIWINEDILDSKTALDQIDLGWMRLWMPVTGWTDLLPLLS